MRLGNEKKIDENQSLRPKRVYGYFCDGALGDAQGLEITSIKKEYHRIPNSYFGGRRLFLLMSRV
jgi:hypothetical protein